MVAAIPAIVAVGSALYGAHQQNKARQKQDDLTKKELANQQEVQGYGKNLLNQGQQGIGPSLNYYTSMLANPRESTAPEQNRISSLYAGQAANVRNQSPRGGYSLGAAESMRGQQRSAQEGVIQQGRPMAASALSNMSMGLSGLGMQGYGMGSGILGNVFNQGLAAREQQFNQGSQIGQGLFNAYQGYLLNRATNTPGGSGTQQLPTSSGQGLYAPGYQPGNFNPGGTSAPSNLYSGTTLPNSGKSGTASYTGNWP